MSAPEKTPLQSVTRAFRIVWLLQGHTFEGVRLKPIAEALGVPMATALRDMEKLAEEGIVERIQGRDQHWHLTPKLIQLARAHDMEMTRVRSRVDEIDQRYTREPK